MEAIMSELSIYETNYTIGHGDESIYVPPTGHYVPPVMPTSYESYMNNMNNAKQQQQQHYESYMNNMNNATKHAKLHCRCMGSCSGQGHNSIFDESFDAAKWHKERIEKEERDNQFQLKRQQEDDLIAENLHAGSSRLAKLRKKNNIS
jgi:hypothetical protein